MTQLHLARNFALPIDAVTSTTGILGIRGSGKTHTAVVIAEEMLATGMQVVVLDPLNVWYGLRTSADGKGAGFPITVLGGEHADIPLEAASGAIVAEFAVNNHASLVLSLRHFSKTDQRRFVADFCEKLYRLKGQSSHRDPVHIIIDEADEVAPQKLAHGSERCFGAVDTLVRRGRSSGIGVTLITQRPAAINKDVLTQIELLIAHRVISPQDRKAIELWIEAHPVGETAKEAAKSLASLSKGECWVWSPSWLDVFKRITIRQRRTFDSSATPKVGERKVTPSGRAVVDLDGLRTAMAETIQKADENDPAKLRKRIAELERQKVPVAAEADHSECRIHADALTKSNAELRHALAEAGQRLDRIRTDAEFKIEYISDPEWMTKPPSIRPSNLLAPTKRSERPPRRVPAESNGDLGAAEMKFLYVLSRNIPGRSRIALALQAGYSAGSRHVDNTLGNLRSHGYVNHGAPITITDAGLKAVRPITVPPDGRDLVQWWCAKVGKAEAAFLTAMLEVYPRELTRKQLCDATDYSHESRHVDNTLGALRTVGLVVRGSIRLSDEVFS